MKKLLAMILSIFLAMLVFAACHPEAIYRGTFNSGSYEKEIDWYSSQTDVASYIPGIKDYREVSDWEFVAREVTNAWPFAAGQYVSAIWLDENKGIWLVHICMDTDGDHIEDGYTALLIRGADGCILSCFVPTGKKWIENVYLQPLFPSEETSFDLNENVSLKILPPLEETFDIKEFEKDIDEFSTQNLYVGPIKDAEDAAAKADAVFKERYDESSLEKQRPYVVLYDEKTDVWFIHGKWPEGDGGFAYMFVQGKDGKVLAVWHDL